uniref:Uncharacterized protein n=1 Tax=Oryza brachyantha TaxID=4533 RepID=J3M3V9_ORYBR
MSRGGGNHGGSSGGVRVPADGGEVHVQRVEYKIVPVMNGVLLPPAAAPEKKAGEVINVDDIAWDSIWRKKKGFNDPATNQAIN